MPSINDIRVELQCVQDLSKGGPVEEFAPRARTVSDNKNLFMPALYDIDTHTCSVFIPIFPRAQFFLKYDTSAMATGTDSKRSSADISKEDAFYVFQLFIGKDEITTWSCGASQDWSGTTSFAMYDTSCPEIHTDGKGLEKRVFMFNGDTRVSGDMTKDRDEDRKIELRVFRADKSMRTPKDVSPYADHGANQDIQTPFGGISPANQAKKYFIFGLIDPVDRPHAVFRWFYRSWDEIHRLRLTLGGLRDQQHIDLLTTGVYVSKDETRKTINVRDSSRASYGSAQRIIQAGIQSTPTQSRLHSPRKDQAIKAMASGLRAGTTRSADVLRYDKMTGKIVPLLRPAIESTVVNQARAAVAVQAVRISDARKASNKMKTAVSPNPKRSSSAQMRSMPVSAAMILPPQHPHARPLSLETQYAATEGRRGAPASSMAPPLRGGRSDPTVVDAWKRVNQ